MTREGRRSQSASAHEILRGRFRWAAIAGLVAALVAIAALMMIRSSGPSGRIGEVAAAFEKAKPCGTKFLGMGSRFVAETWDPSRVGLDPSSALDSRYGRCDPWWPADPAVMWAEFASPEDLEKAVRSIRDDEPSPYCTTSTELFFLHLDTADQLREFCRDVGASEPVGKPLS